MKKLKYIIEDKTIAELLGVQNFNNDESAVLELVKNAYDAKSKKLEINFLDNQLVVLDSGVGMDISDIKKYWMHVGYSKKTYAVVDENEKRRVLAGSKGIGRFALARLGANVKIFSKKKGKTGIIWETDWGQSTLSECEDLLEVGTKIIITNLREKWDKRKVNKLISFLQKTYNDDAMEIIVTHPEVSARVLPYFSEPRLGSNCLSIINMSYNCKNQTLKVDIRSDEFLEEATAYCNGINLSNHISKRNMVEELSNNDEWSNAETLEEGLRKLGSFESELYFAIKPTKVDTEKFLYKHAQLPNPFPEGIILYRNAFSISSYEGKKDWLGLGKRSRKSPAAATHPTGAWRVRENQVSGKVQIDKHRNKVLQDLSNRQGLDENIFYDLFIEVILTGLREFEQYRQSIIRRINSKNTSEDIEKHRPIIDKIVLDPNSVRDLTPEEAKTLAKEILSSQNENKEAKREKAEVESRYKYDVRVLNVLATVGLKASSIAHEMRNDRNAIAEDTNCVIDALKEYGMWEELLSPEKTMKSHKNVPYLLNRNSKTSSKLIAFMNAMLSEVEKKQFVPSWQNIYDILQKVRREWERDYAWITINIKMDKSLCFLISEDMLHVVLDNLILNSVQQNESSNHLTIDISITQSANLLEFTYRDNGIGLAKKYKDNPRRILEVHETTRKNGHGLGMWIVNNTVTISGGSILHIGGNNGFLISFTVGGQK